MLNIYGPRIDFFLQRHRLLIYEWLASYFRQSSFILGDCKYYSNNGPVPEIMLTKNVFSSIPLVCMVSEENYLDCSVGWYLSEQKDCNLCLIFKGVWCYWPGRTILHCLYFSSVDSIDLPQNIILSPMPFYMFDISHSRWGSWCYQYANDTELYWSMKTEL